MNTSLENILKLYKEVVIKNEIKTVIQFGNASDEQNIIVELQEFLV